MEGRKKGLWKGRRGKWRGGAKRTTYNDIYHENDTAKLVILYAN